MSPSSMKEAVGTRCRDLVHVKEPSGKQSYLPPYAAVLLIVVVPL